MKSLVRALVISSTLILATVAAHADTINLSFTPNANSAGMAPGTGAFTINGSIPTTGDVTYYQGGDLTAMQFTFGIRTYGFNQDGANIASVEFDNGQLVSIFYRGAYGAPLTPSSLLVKGPEYEFTAASGLVTNGTWSVTSTVYDPSNPTAFPSATPEPSSIALLGTGLLGVAGVVRKRLFNS